jgi:hypothetical protein
MTRATRSLRDIGSHDRECPSWSLVRAGVRASHAARLAFSTANINAALLRSA